MVYGFTYTLPTITGTHTDFPVVLREADFPGAALDGGASSIDNGGGNLRAYTSPEKTTQLPLDIVEFVAGGTPSVIVWVKVPSLYTSATIYLEADDTETTQPAVTGTYGRNAVWADYFCVLHLAEASGDFIDSTGNERGIVSTSDTGITRQAACNTGYGISIDSTSPLEQGLVVSDPLGAWEDSVTEETISAWASRGSTDLGGPNLILEIGGDTIGRAIYYRSGPNTVHYGTSVSGSDEELDSSTTFSESSSEFLIHGRMNAGSTALFVNGSSEATGSNGSGHPAFSSDVAIASDGAYLSSWTDAIGGGVNQWEGLLSEIRVRRSVLSGDWIATEYDNQNASTAWGTVGSWADSGEGGVELTVSDFSCSTGYDAAALIQQNTLSVADSSFAKTYDNVVVSLGNIELGVSDSGYAFAFDDLNLVQQSIISVAGVSFSNSFDNISLNQQNILSVDDLIISESYENIELQQGNTLSVNELLFSFEFDNTDLQQNNILSLGDSYFSSSYDGVNLQQGHLLLVDESGFQNSYENLSLAAGNFLVVSEFINSLSYDGVEITQANILSTNSVNFTIAYNGIDINQNFTLIVDDSGISIDFENTNLTQSNVISVDSTLLNLLYDGIVLDQSNILTVSDATFAILFDNLSIGGGVFTIEGSRLVRVSNLDNIVSVSSKDRIVKVSGDDNVVLN